MKERFEKLFLILYAWTIGLVGGLIFLTLRILGRVKVEGYSLKKLIPPTEEGMIVIYNHPSLVEPVILPLLFFPWYLFSPRMMPFSTPDKENFYDKIWFLPFRPVSIPIPRKKVEGERYKFLKQLFQKIREGRIIILAPEGGRTFKGREFKIIEKGKILIKNENWEKIKEEYPEAPKIRRFHSGTSFLLRKAKTILPIWTEGGDKVLPNKFSFSETLRFPLFPRFWKRIKIRIGEPINSQDIPDLEKLENILLKCSGAVIK